jgi:hypothetical protein
MARCTGSPATATAVRTVTFRSWRTEPQVSLLLPKGQCHTAAGHHAEQLTQQPADLLQVRDQAALLADGT